MSPTQREDMAAAILDATIPLRERIAELEKDLESASEGEASLLSESLNVCRVLGIDTSGDYDMVACAQQLQADLKRAQEQLQELAPMRPVLEQLRLIAFGTPNAPSVDTPKVLSLNGLTLWGAGSGAELLLLRLLWAVRDMTDQRKA